jgi:uncharacterized SAM-binding protein YcdF (DUF218 family)
MARRARRRGLRLLGALACLVVLGWFAGPRLLAALGRYLVTDQPLERADAIAVLAGGVPGRPMEAAELHREGWAPRIILSDEQKAPGYYELADRGLRLPWTLERSERVVAFLGVDRRAVDRIEQDFGSTVEELCGLVRHARAQRYRTLILVSDQFHTTRAAKIMALLSDGEVRTIARASRYTLYRGERWWESRRGARELLFEYQKLLNHWRIAAQTRLAGWARRLLGRPRTAFDALCRPEPPPSAARAGR